MHGDEHDAHDCHDSMRNNLQDKLRGPKVAEKKGCD